MNALLPLLFAFLILVVWFAIILMFGGTHGLETYLVNMGFAR